MKENAGIHVFHLDPISVDIMMLFSVRSFGSTSSIIVYASTEPDLFFCSFSELGDVRQENIVLTDVFVSAFSRESDCRAYSISTRQLTHARL